MIGTDDAARLLAEIHAARGLLRASVPAGGPTHAALWTHATREPGRVVDLAVERAIRHDPAIARRYRSMLAAQALAHAPLAVAASDGPLSSRRVGPFALDILPAEADTPPLLILRGEGRMPRVIEAMRGEEAVRLDLGEPVDGSIVLALDPAVPEAERLGRLLGDPASAVFLL